MRASELLHYAFRARDPERLAFFYADLLEADFFLEPTMAALGIMMIKLNRSDALFRGLIEFWPWDVEWDGSSASFRRVAPRPAQQTYGHMALKIGATASEIAAELERRNIPFRMELRGPGVEIPVIDDPEGNFVELFPNLDHMNVPPEFIVSRGQAAAAIAQLRAGFAPTLAARPNGPFPLMPPGAR